MVFVLASVAGAAPAPGKQLIATGELGAGSFGESVALSGNGKIAMVAAPEDANVNGAVWVYTRSAAGWRPGAKLTVPVAKSPDENHFGRSLALSNDGTTALIGEYDDVLVYTGSGRAWHQQAKLTIDGSTGLGESVALSSNGSTALIGDESDAGDKGKVWVFTRAGSSWHAQVKLTAGHAAGPVGFGDSVALSGDGHTALIGGDDYHNAAGAAWVFVHAHGSWTQQGATLTSPHPQPLSDFGRFVSLSRDGATVAINDSSDAWVFSRKGASWRPVVKLVGSDETRAGDLADATVALSADGGTVVLGRSAESSNAGRAWLFRPSGSTWKQAGSALTLPPGARAGELGFSAALSSDGSTALIGAIGVDPLLGDAPGAAFVFARKPA
jgi:FG-GAP repeat